MASIEQIRHSLAHLLASAVLEKDPKAKLAIGPAIDTGFYYDIEFSKPLSSDDLPALDKRMRELAEEGLGFEHIDVTPAEARKQFKDQPYKLELIDELEQKGEQLSLYKTGDFTDLCRGGHVENTNEIPLDGFKLSHLAGAYWRGDEKNPQLTRVYGLAFESKEKLDEYLKMMEEMEKRDHRKLGKELGIFEFSETVGKGLPLWTEKGAAIRRELERFIVDEELKRDYHHVYTPDMAKIDLYKKSGHYPYYADSMYAPIKIDEEEFMLRPMTCPHHFELYLSKPRSYRELPMRIAELAKLYRYERSGELSGLVRVRSFCLSDAHIICSGPEQAAEEAKKALDLIEYACGIFGLKKGEDFWYRLSLGDRKDDKKYFKDDAAWDMAEQRLREVLKQQGTRFVEAENEAAFYGPKIDIQMRDARGKENTAFTVQYDFVMPGRFNLQFTDSDGKEKSCIVIHRSSIGAIERVVAFLIERYMGAFPLWLSPVQVRILPVAAAHEEYAESLRVQLRDAGIRVEVVGSSETLGKRIRQSKVEKLPYIAVVGAKEVEANQVTLEHREQGSLGAMSVEQALERLQNEIKNKNLPG